MVGVSHAAPVLQAAAAQIAAFAQLTVHPDPQDVHNELHAGKTPDGTWWWFRAEGLSPTYRKARKCECVRRVTTGRVQKLEEALAGEHMELVVCRVVGAATVELAKLK